MVLETLYNPFVLTSLLLDFDNITTYAAVKKFGVQTERNDWLRTLIERNGNGLGNIIHNVRNQFLILGKGLGLYLLDYSFGIQNEPMNFHKTYLYCWSLRVSFAVASNSYVLITEKKSLVTRLNEFL